MQNPWKLSRRPDLHRRRIPPAIVAAACLMVAVSGCAEPGGGGAGSSSSSAAGTPTSSAAPTLESRLLSVDDLPDEGWTVVPPATAADPATGDTGDVAAVCEGDFRSVLELPSSTVTASFEREGRSFTEQLIPNEDPEAVVEQLRSEVSACFGSDARLTGQDATVTYEPLPDPTFSDDAFGAVTTITASSGVISPPFLAAAVGDAVVFTQLTAPQGQSVDAGELVRLTEVAVGAAGSNP